MTERIIDTERIECAGEEVVRCLNCFYWRDEDFCANPQWQANKSHNGLVEFPCTFPESFCSFGERRDA